MDLRDIFKNDLSEISEAVGTRCMIRGRHGNATIHAIVSDYSITNANIPFTDGNAVSASCQFDGDKVPFAIVIGDKVEADGIRYRVSNVTRTHGDCSVTLALTVEGQR